MTTYAIDSAIPPKKLYFRELIASLKHIGKGLSDGNEGKNAENDKIVRPLTSAGAKSSARAQVRVTEYDPITPKTIIRKLTPKEAREIIGEGCSLIKTVEKDLIPGIERRVKRIYEKGNTTPTTLQRYLEHDCDLEPWQAERIVNDQMRKYEARAEREHYKKSGVTKVRWVHGDSREPRPWHCKHYPYGLAGKVFDINEPQLIDPEKGIYGYPGDLIGCTCHLEAVE